MIIDLTSTSASLLQFGMAFLIVQVQIVLAGWHNEPALLTFHLTVHTWLPACLGRFIASLGVFVICINQLF